MHTLNYVRHTWLNANMKMRKTYLKRIKKNRGQPQQEAFLFFVAD